MFLCSNNINFWISSQSKVAYQLFGKSSVPAVVKGLRLFRRNKYYQFQIITGKPNYFGQLQHVDLFNVLIFSCTQTPSSFRENDATFLNNVSEKNAVLPIANNRMSYRIVFFILLRTIVTLSPLDGPYGPKTNTGIDNFSGGSVENIVNVLIAVFYNSLRFHLSYLTMQPPEKRRIL